MGPEVQYSILDYSLMVNEIGTVLGYVPTRIEVEDSGKEFAICMDCSRLRFQTGWTCNVDDGMIIRKLFENKLNG